MTLIGLVLVGCLLATQIWNGYIAGSVSRQQLTFGWASLTTTGSMMLGQQQRDQGEN